MGRKNNLIYEPKLSTTILPDLVIPLPHPLLYIIVRLCSLLSLRRGFALQCLSLYHKEAIRFPHTLAVCQLICINNSGYMAVIIMIVGNWQCVMQLGGFYTLCVLLFLYQKGVFSGQKLLLYIHRLKTSESCFPKRTL